MSDIGRAVRGTQKGLSILEEGLMSMHQRRAEYGPNYQFFAEGFVEEILKLRAQLDEMIGLTDYLKEYGPPPAEQPPIESTAPVPAAGRRRSGIVRPVPVPDPSSSPATT